MMKSSFSDYINIKKNKATPTPTPENPKLNKALCVHMMENIRPKPSKPNKGSNTASPWPSQAKKGSKKGSNVFTELPRVCWGASESVRYRACQSVFTELPRVCLQSVPEWDSGIRRFGDSGIRRFGDSEIRGFKDSVIRGLGDSGARGFGDLRIR